MNKQKVPQIRSAILDVHSPIYLKSLKGKYCGGDVGDIYGLVDMASKAGFGYLQFTPIQDTGHNPCPYMGRSIFSYNPIFLSLDHLETEIDFNQIDKDLLQRVKKGTLDHVGYRRLYDFKVQVLRQLFDKAKGRNIMQEEGNEQVLAYAVFCALRNKYRSKWINWPNKFKFGSIQNIIKNHPSLHSEINFYLFSQRLLGGQWADLNEYASQKGVKLIFDKPIYPVHDSAEVWANQDLFYLNPDGSLKMASGCNNPKDPFGAQYWGHAVYKYKQKPKEVIEYYSKSIAFMSRIAQTIRLDHALALVWKYYLMKPHSENGKHVPAIKHKLFNVLIKKYPGITFIAEDLGYVSKRNVDEPLIKHNIPGMRSLQWFKIPKYARVFAYPKLCLAMTSNHDLDSLPRWWQKLRQSRKLIFWKQIAEPPAKDYHNQIWQIVGLVFGSEALWASITLRDLTFDLRRYNMPGVKNSQNWTERMHINIEDVDFNPIGTIIKSSNRRNGII
ncbi:MAG: 4-alpha-glucanotransferase [bacterium ADurb.Bin212]|nr:MAG: 4-alpha-glucanotransferase [bacterium ADurb.Bin212]